MRRLLVLAVLSIALLTALNTPASKAMIPCDQANAACEAFADADMESCVIVYGESITPDQFKACTAHAAHVYAGCMDAHGCPIIN